MPPEDGFSPSQCPERRAASSDAKVHLGEVYLSQWMDSTPGSWLLIHGVLQVGNNLARRFLQ